uniref:NodB homology domain-containing protein n=1 Tax=uncultured Thiotrichaceae bacterium TaxID=298394 RepID=A0A6S6UJM3_9GAMM|nr:MAG: Unknown protein [uncultured Thiotrichaceae bacterium]
MLTYRPSNVSKPYRHSANPPRLDKICFTIDHVHAGNGSVCSTYELVRYLVHKNIPVTVFIQATSPGNDYELDFNNAQLLYQLAPHLVTLGVHPLSSNHGQREQSEVHNVINDIIERVTGRKPTLLSYHGHRAGPTRGIVFPGIQYARGIHSQSVARQDRLNTPVMPLSSVTAAYNYIKKRNEDGLTGTFFSHSAEMRSNNVKKRVFDNLVREVLSQRLHAISYLKAMNHEFGGSGGSTPVTPSPTPAPSDSEQKYGLRLSALTEQGFRPLNANFEVRSSNGRVVASASNQKQVQFHLPPAIYQANARVNDTSITQPINLTVRHGLHQKFLFPA